MQMDVGREATETHFPSMVCEGGSWVAILPSAAMALLSLSLRETVVFC